MKVFSLAFILVVVSPQILFAQASVSGGFGLPLVLLPSSSDFARTIGPALWGEAAFVSPSRVVSLHTGLDWSTPYKKEWRRGTRVTGSGTYQETVLSQGIGIRLRSTERSEITAVGGFGIGVMRIDETARIAPGGSGRAQTQRTRATRIDPCDRAERWFSVHPGLNLLDFRFPAKATGYRPPATSYGSTVTSARRRSSAVHAPISVRRRSSVRRWRADSPACRISSSVG